jgi:1-phosphatidylinositol phosphodiesterase
MTLADQLSAGVRFLDIRCRHFHDAFAIHHLGEYQNLEFGPGVVDVCLTFLDHHPRECVVMSIKEEFYSWGCSRSFQRTLEAYIAASPASWYLGDSVPRLGDVRGRIVLLVREKLPLGIDANPWRDNDTFSIDNNAQLRIQDEYRVPTVFNIDDKWDKVKALANEAQVGSQSRWYINFSSGTQGTSPETIAKGSPGIRGVNDFLFDYLVATPATRVGTIMMDFPEYPGEGLIEELISHNVFEPDLGRQITCIRKHKHGDANHPIRWVGGIGIPSGQPFKMTRTECIDAIQNGGRFFVQGPDGSVANVRVSLRKGIPYIATVDDSSTEDNLLSLPECPRDRLDRMFPYG